MLAHDGWTQPRLAAVRFEASRWGSIQAYTSECTQPLSKLPATSMLLHPKSHSAAPHRLGGFVTVPPLSAVAFSRCARTPDSALRDCLS
ncbi:hypothetical protein M8818_001402 [Zalaria obscura]|uniref:Uncharacterized protein n=1 Tax=Zalaria obscura TaxID=2024903 RepID=A0ACC3SKC3_9PEZI